MPKGWPSLIAVDGFFEWKAIKGPESQAALRDSRTHNYPLRWNGARRAKSYW